MKKSLLIGVLAAAVLATSLSGCGSESTSALEDYLQDIADVSDTDDEAEDVKDEDSEQEAEASEDDTADEDDAVVVSDEAYIEHLEAYQEYYNSVKDEADDVVATISLDEDNLPILWIGYADDLFMRKDDDGIQNDYINDFDGYFEVYGYEKKDVTLLAKSPSYLTNGVFVYLKSDELTINDHDGFYTYDKDGEEFVRNSIIRPDRYAGFNYNWYIKNEDTGVLSYFGHEELNNANVTKDEATESDYAYFWWDDSEVSYEEWDKVAVYGRCIADYATFLDAASFNVLIENLKSSPIYDINLLAVEYDAFYLYWEDGVRYSVEYLGYDKLNEYLAE